MPNLGQTCVAICVRTCTACNKPGSCYGKHDKLMIVLPNELSHQQSEGRLFSSRFILPIFKSSQIKKDPPPAAKAHIMQHYWNRFVADVDKGLCHARLVSESGERDGMGEKRSVGRSAEEDP